MITRYWLTICLLALALVGCEKPREDKLRTSAEQQLRASLYDPDSYEFVDLTLVDSVSYADNIKKFRRDREYLIESSVYHEGKASLEDKRMVAGVDSIKTALGSKVNETAAYVYTFKFYAKDSLGVKVLETYLIQVGPSPDFAVLKLALNRGELLAYPNAFPGYDELTNRAFGLNAGQ